MSELDDLYDGREQTLVKHHVLRLYLQRFALIIGSWSDSITYVDCFSGPWSERSEVLDDTSFAIAIKQLRDARRELGKDVRLRCFFIEQKRSAYEKLQKYAEQISDVEIETKNAKFEDSIADILRFVGEDPRTFPFLLIDPKGWSIPLDVIRPLLRLDPGEVLITFMLEFIRRFIGHPDESVRGSFDALYGERGISERFSELRGEDRDNVLLDEYVHRVQSAGRFKYASASLVLHPKKERRHFNLVYLTRHHKGIEVFKEAERKAMEAMERARANAAKRRRESGGQADLFGAEVLHKNLYFDGLREQYLRRNERRMLEALQSDGVLNFDKIWASSLRSPLIWPSDIKAQLEEWRKNGLIKFDGLAPNQRVPRYGRNNRVILLR